MKKHIHKVLLALTLTGVLFTSCDGYLDVVPKGSEVMTRVDQYAALFNSQNKHIYGFYDDPIRYINDDVWYAMSVVSDPNTLATKAFLYTPAESSNRFSLFTSNSLYTACYARISTVCNITIDNIGDATGDDGLRRKTLAEARALRAYNYFILVNIYGKHYNGATAATDLSVPYWVHYDLEARPRQATVAEIYQLMEDDLNVAIPHLDEVPANGYHFSKAAAYALLAKIYLMKGDFANAERYAKLSYDSNSYVDNLVATLDVTGTPVQTKGTQNKENLYYATRTLNPSTAFEIGAISPELSGMFDQVNDFRFAKFLSFNTTSLGTPTATTEVARGDSRFAAVFDNTLSGAKYYYSNSAGLRTTDVILILAECAARKSDYTTMMKYVDEVRTKRIKGYVRPAVAPASWQEALMDIVVAERRKEFMTNTFQRWCDLRRLNVEFNRTTTRTFPANPNIPTSPQQTYSLPANSDWWVMPLPSSEFQYYPNMKYVTTY